MTRLRRTKIVCTIGPATPEQADIEALIRAGLDVARLNLSHDRLETHLERIRLVRAAAAAVGKHVGILLDIQGPKIRIGDIDGKLSLKLGDELRLTTEEVVSDGRRLTVRYPHLTTDLKPDSTILLDDGLVELTVERIEGDDVVTRVVAPGLLKSGKGVSLPGVAVDLPPLTERDERHIEFAADHGVDLIAASFVRRGAHVENIRAAIRRAGGDQPIIAKIESDEGIAHLEEIVEAADGVMVARGDMGVEIPPEEVPLAQKRIISACKRAGKPVITATQMLESMVHQPRPTRAEVTDVASAIFDGTDAVMLSGETAVGQYPEKAVGTMAAIAQRIDRAVGAARGRWSADAVSFSPFRFATGKPSVFGVEASRSETGDDRDGDADGDNDGAAPLTSIAEAISRATAEAASALKLRAIISSTQSGSTARMVSKYRPVTPIVAVTPFAEVARRLSVVWGVVPLVVPYTDKIDDMIDVAVKAAVEHEHVKPGDAIALTAGVRTGVPGSTNLLQVHIVPDERSSGKD